MYKCSSNPYQLLRSDTEAHSNEWWNGGDLSRKQTPKAINFNECNYRKHGTVKHYSTTIRVISLNVIGQSINQLYMLKRNVRPFYIDHACHWWISLRGGARIFQRYGTTLKVLQNLFSLTTAIGGWTEHLLASVLQSRQQCPLYGQQRLCDSSSITSNHGDYSQNSLATITT